MKCSACSAELPDTAKFCPECGEKIVRKTVCPGCGTEAAPGAKFCVECGHKFAAAPAPAPKPAAPEHSRPAAEPTVPEMEPPVREPDGAAEAVARAFKMLRVTDGKLEKISKADADLVAAAAEAGNPRAMYLLSEILSDGFGGRTADKEKALVWLRKSADAGDAYGMTMLGLLHTGAVGDYGVEKDMEAAGAWIAKGAAALGVCEKDPVFMFGAMLLLDVAKAADEAGPDAPPDLSLAAPTAEALLDAAGDATPETARVGDKDSIGGAHFVLAMDAMAKQDFDLAREHFEQGAAFGNKDCKEALEEIENGGAADDESDDEAGEEGGDDAGDDAGDEAEEEVDDDGDAVDPGDDDGTDEDEVACAEQPSPSLKTGLTPEQSAKLKSLCEEARGNAATSIFSIGPEIDFRKLQKFAEAGQSKLGVANLHFSLDVRQAANQMLISARLGRPAPDAPVAFFDGTMFGSGKAGLLLTPKGLYSVNGMLGDKACPSGFLSWDDLAGENGTLEMFGDYNLQFCSSPQVGVNLATFPAKGVREILVKFRAFLREKK